jgi:hypothetical protein
MAIPAQCGWMTKQISRHCEQSEAISILHNQSAGDCFVTVFLAMTKQFGVSLEYNDI